MNGDTNLQIPDFIVHERDLENAPLDAESDEDFKNEVVITDTFIYFLMQTWQCVYSKI